MTFNHQGPIQRKGKKWQNVKFVEKKCCQPMGAI